MATHFEKKVYFEVPDARTKWTPEMYHTVVCEMRRLYLSADPVGAMMNHYFAPWGFYGAQETDVMAKIGTARG